MADAPAQAAISSSLASRALLIAPRFIQRNLIPRLHPRFRALLQDDIFIRSAIATVSIAVGVAAVHRLWFMRQVRDVEKDAKEEELPAVPSVADDSDAELWEEEEPDASTFVKDSGSHWENMHVDALIAARFQSSEDKDMYAAIPSAMLPIVCVITLCNMVAAIDKAIMLKSTEELMKARAVHADDAAAYVSSRMFICSSPRIHTRCQLGAPSLFSSS